MGDKLGVYGLLSVVVLILLVPLGWRVLCGQTPRQRLCCVFAIVGLGALALWWAVWGHGPGLWGLLLPLLVPVVMVLGWLGLSSTQAENRPPPPAPPAPPASPPGTP